MPSERVQRQIDRLLDEAEEAGARQDWATVLARARHVLTYDPANEDALAFLAAAERGLWSPSTTAALAADAVVWEVPQPSLIPRLPSMVRSRDPASLANGRYEVVSVLGQGGMGT